MLRAVPLRPRRAAAVVAALCVLTSAACGGSGGGEAASSATASSASGTYLALGDSVPFGYRGAPAGTDYSKAAAFVGYPQLVGAKLGLDVVNAACPGETTASFTDVTAQSNGCENSVRSAAGYRTFYPLHVLYDSVKQSQLDFAVRTLKRTPKVSLVTLQVGANDAFVCQQTTADGCATEVGTVARTLETNVGRILAALRGEGGYRGRIVVVTYYSLDYANDQILPARALADALTAAAHANGATVASGFDAFRTVAAPTGGNSVAAGLVIGNDVHPTAKGQELLAAAVEQAVTG